MLPFRADSVARVDGGAAYQPFAMEIGQSDGSDGVVNHNYTAQTAYFARDTAMLMEGRMTDKSTVEDSPPKQITKG